MKKQPNAQKKHFILNATNLKKNHIKNRILGVLTFKGKKNTSEKILLKSFKELQKYSYKKSEYLIKLSLISTLPVFTTHTSKNKKTKRIKETYIFINNQYARTSLAIKLILKGIQKENYNFSTNFKHTINFDPIDENEIDFKEEQLQKQILIKAHYFKYFKF